MLSPHKSPTNKTPTRPAAKRQLIVGNSRAAAGNGLERCRWLVQGRFTLAAKKRPLKQLSRFLSFRLLAKAACAFQHSGATYPHTSINRPIAFRPFAVDALQSPRIGTIRAITC